MSILMIIVLSLWFICIIIIVSWAVSGEKERTKEIIDIVDDNADNVIVFMKKLPKDDKVRVVVIWDKGKVEIIGRLLFGKL